MRTVLHRIVAAVAALALAGAVSVAVAGSAGAAPNARDTAFITSNGQTQPTSTPAGSSTRPPPTTPERRAALGPILDAAHHHTAHLGARAAGDSLIADRRPGHARPDRAETGPAVGTFGTLDGVSGFIQQCQIAWSEDDPELRCDLNAVVGPTMGYHFGAVEGTVSRVEQLKAALCGRTDPDLLRSWSCWSEAAASVSRNVARTK